MYIQLSFKFIYKSPHFVGYGSWNWIINCITLHLHERYSLNSVSKRRDVVYDSDVKILIRGKREEYGAYARGICPKDPL